MKEKGKGRVGKGGGCSHPVGKSGSGSGRVEEGRREEAEELGLRCPLSRHFEHGLSISLSLSLFLLYNSRISCQKKAC